MRTSGGRGSTRAQRENVALATARRASHVVAKSSSITDQIEKPALRAGFFASVADEDVCQSGGVPFTGRLAEHAAPLPGDRVKGKITVFPLTIPAVPHGNRCCALRSPPGLQPAVGSTRPARPFRGSLLSRFASCRHPWRPALVLRPSVRRFQRGARAPLYAFSSQNVQHRGGWGRG